MFLHLCGCICWRTIIFQSYGSLKLSKGLVALETILKVRIDQSGILIHLIDLLSLIDCFLIIMLPSLQAMMYIHPMHTMKTETVEEDSTESFRYQVGS